MPFKKVEEFCQLTIESQQLNAKRWWCHHHIEKLHLCWWMMMVSENKRFVKFRHRFSERKKDFLTSSNMLILSSTMKRVFAAISSLIPSKSSSNSARDLILMSLKSQSYIKPKNHHHHHLWLDLDAESFIIMVMMQYINQEIICCITLTCS